MQLGKEGEMDMEDKREGDMSREELGQYRETVDEGKVELQEGMNTQEGEECEEANAELDFDDKTDRKEEEGETAASEACNLEEGMNIDEKVDNSGGERERERRSSAERGGINGGASGERERTAEREAGMKETTAAPARHTAEGRLERQSTEEAAVDLPAHVLHRLRGM